MAPPSQMNSVGLVLITEDVFFRPPEYGEFDAASDSGFCSS